MGNGERDLHPLIVDDDEDDTDEEQTAVTKLMESMEESIKSCGVTIRDAATKSSEVQIAASRTGSHPRLQAVLSNPPKRG